MLNTRVPMCLQRVRAGLPTIAGEDAPPRGITYRSIQGCFNRELQRDVRYGRLSRTLSYTVSSKDLIVESVLAGLELKMEFTPLKVFGTNKGWDLAIFATKIANNIAQWGLELTGAKPTAFQLSMPLLGCFVTFTA